MPTHEIQVRQHYALEPDAVFAKFAEHENLNIVFAPSRISRLNDGDSERNGVGSRRRIKMGPGAVIEETVTVYEPSSLIQYTLTKGGAPINDHLGTLRFSPAAGGGTDLTYSIRLGSKVPGAPQIVGAVLKATLKRGLPKINR